MKTYEVSVECHTTIAVKARNEEHALEIADESVRTRGFDAIFVIDDELDEEVDVDQVIRHSVYHQMDSQKTPYEE